MHQEIVIRMKWKIIWIPIESVFSEFVTANLLYQIYASQAIKVQACVYCWCVMVKAYMSQREHR